MEGAYEWPVLILQDYLDGGLTDNYNSEVYMTCNFIGRIKSYEEGHNHNNKKSTAVHKQCSGTVIHGGKTESHLSNIAEFFTSNLCKQCNIELHGVDEVNECGTEIVSKLKRLLPNVRMIVSQSGSVYFHTPGRNLRISDHKKTRNEKEILAYDVKELLILGEYRSNNRYLVSKPSKSEIESAVDFILNKDKIVRMYISGRDRRSSKKKNSYQH